MLLNMLILAWKLFKKRFDQITRSDGSVNTFIRHNQYVENDELVKIVLKLLTTATLSLTINDNSGITVPYNLILTLLMMVLVL